MILRSLIAGAIALACFSTLADARPWHHQHPQARFVEGGSVHCDDRFPATCDVRGWREGAQAQRQGGAGPKGEIVANPAGCPRVAFCGCGAAVELFGRPIRALWLAANWFRFPRAEPAAGMAAVRQHHVMVIRQYLGGGLALVYDANSGSHLTRVHVRSLAGYRIVNPKAG